MQENGRDRPLRPGKITKLVVQDKNPNRVSLFVEGAFAFGVYQDLVLEFGLQVGKTLSVAEQARILEADQVFIAKAKALHYLGYRARTEHEVRQKLRRSGFGEEVVERVVERLHSLEYLDDDAYARDYVRARFSNKGYGPRRIRSELVRRGVGRRLIDTALEEVFRSADTHAAAREQAEKRWPRLAGEADPYKRRKKLSSFLLRRGFSYDTIARVVEELEQEEQ